MSIVDHIGTCSKVLSDDRSGKPRAAGTVVDGQVGIGSACGVKVAVALCSNGARSGN